jgi:triosephosphate isomerase (TIM)
MSRIPIIIGNWKMYKTQKEAKAFIDALAPLVSTADKRILLAVPFTALAHTSEAAESSRITIGGQNMHDHVEGAFTGEISARMLKDAGAAFVLLGHSERRHLFGETSAFINRKLCRALAEEILPILCIGETLQERQEGHTERVLSKQLEEGLKSLSPAQVCQILIAYEPVWAIGTGETLDPKGAQAIHLTLRTFLKNRYDAKTAQNISLLYGGSVKPDNAALLMQQEDVDGLLVGGASLEAQTFMKIINC